VHAAPPLSYSDRSPRYLADLASVAIGIWIGLVVNVP
jgi:hypothetical protein